MNRTRLHLLLAAAFFVATPASGDEPAFPARLRIAFASNRDHYWYPRILLYDHDGAGQGRIAAVLPGPLKRLDHHPALSADGKLCVFGSEAEGGVGQLIVWDVAKNAAVEAAELVKSSPNAFFSPSLSLDGKLLAFTTWNRPGSSPRWDVQLFDLGRKTLVDLPELNSTEADERRVAISGDGRWLAFTTNARDGRGLTDVRLYDRETRQVDRLPELNTPSSENFPTLSRDGRWLAIISDREGGAGSQDVYLFDREHRRLTPLPGLNAPGQEQSPSLSPSGRYVTFVSERFDQAGEHDVLLYDRDTGRLLPTPGLNAARDDYDPVVVELPM